MIQDSTLSPKRPQVNHPASAVGVQVPEIRPWISRNIEKPAQCSLDEMLKDLLMDCTVEPRESFDEAYKTDLFKKCLDKILPICNGTADTRMEDMKGKSDQVKNTLAEYLGTLVEAEKELYPYFVKAVNTALLFLKDLEIEDVRPAKGLPAVCFHVHDSDSTLLAQSFQGQVSRRKPDVIVVSDADVRDALGSEKDKLTESDLFLGVATRVPMKPFEWRSVRTFVELKRSRSKVELPPESYSLSQQTSRQKREYLTVNVPSKSDLDALPDGPAPSGDNPQLEPPLPASVRPSCHSGKAAPASSKSRKRTSEQLGLPECQSKRQKKDHPVIVQAGYYAAEMFAAHTARLHAIGLVVVGDVLYLWRYDRQGAIRCSAFNFIQDLPRFLVLLLAMQRFSNQHWGLNPDIDPNFGRRPVSHQTNLYGEKGEKINVSLELSDEERFAHFGLNGPATDVFSVKSENLSDQENDLVVKAFWAEVTRTSEPDILKRVYGIAEGNAEVKGHVPEMLWYKVFKDTSTVKIRERLGLKTQGARVLYMIIFRKLRPITELWGENFLRAWWATVLCHLALWKNEVYHRDISPSNLMYRKDKGKIMGVLNDFDLASTQETATGTECTGTLPFIAMKLLEREGVTRHIYEHDAESFIWVLIWISLRYGKGKLRELARGRPLDDWLTFDATGYRQKKLFFLFTNLVESLKAGKGHKKHWKLAKEYICVVKNLFDKKPIQDGHEEPSQYADQEPLHSSRVDIGFQTLLKDPMSPYLKGLY